MKRLLLLLAVMLSPNAHASELSDAFDSLRQVFLKTPEIKEVTFCYANDVGCETFDTSQLSRKGGTPEVMWERPKEGEPSSIVASAVERIVGSAGNVIGVGGRIKVKYQDTKKGITVDVEVSFGTGSGAAPAAGGNPAPAPALPSRPGGGGGSSGHAVLN